MSRVTRRPAWFREALRRVSAITPIYRRGALPGRETARSVRRFAARLTASGLLHAAFPEGRPSRAIAGPRRGGLDHLDGMDKIAIAFS